MTRSEAERLLPFLANGTLDGAERAALEAMLATDPELTLELAALRAVRQSLQDEEVTSPGAFGLARLMRDVGREQDRAEDRAAPPALPDTASVQPLWRQTRVWQIAAALLLAVVVGQAALVDTGSEPGPGYRLAGEAALQISFDPGLTEARLREILLDAGAEIIAGPSALGFYDLAPLPGVPLSDLRAALQAAEGVETVTELEPQE